MSNRLLLDEGERDELWTALVAEIESYLREVPALPVTPAIDAAAIRAWLDAADFGSPLAPADALRQTARMLRVHQVQMASPRYFGLFNPAATTMSIAADAVVAALNPQLATWLRSPFAVEVERTLLRRFGAQFGFAAETAGGTFTNGGTEANLTAIVAALASRLPGWAEHGVAGFSPRIYCSTQAHDSLRRAARVCGLGSDGVAGIAVDERLRMSPAALARAIARDRAARRFPLMLVATAGTSAAGAIDPLDQLASVAAENGLWYHVDAAYGGFAALVPELRGLLHGIERADSVTFDAHKMLSVSMGAGMFITPHPELLTQAFDVATNYMPLDHGEHEDPYTRSLQWSRRFIGLKVFLSLLVAGWDGYREALRRQTALGDLLRRRLAAEGWDLRNDTPLPIVCFSAPGLEPGDLSAICDAVTDSGRAWISVCTLPSGPALRAAITSHRTAPEDIDELTALLRNAREVSAKACRS